MENNNFGTVTIPVETYDKFKLLERDFYDEATRFYSQYGNTIYIVSPDEATAKIIAENKRLTERVKVLYEEKTNTRPTRWQRLKAAW